MGVAADAERFSRPSGDQVQGRRSLLFFRNHGDRLCAWGAEALRLRWLLFTMLCAGGGCKEGGVGINWLKPPPATAPASSPDPPASGLFAPRDETAGTAGPQRPRMIIQISFDVLRARVTRGFFSQSEKVWNHLNETAIQPETTVLLQRNGLRVARGDANSLPPIRALLEQQGQVETSQNRMVMSNSLPLVVEPDMRPRDQTLFMFRPDGTLGGASYPQSVNGFLIEYDLVGVGDDRLKVTIMPQVRLPKQPPRLTSEVPGFIDQPLMPPTRVFRELAFTVEIGPEQFIAIGPSRLIENAHLIGSLLICEENEGRKQESMYLITPRVLNTGHRLGF